MVPRVSEAARIFVVAAFLVLVAQGPTFGGGVTQLAQSGATVVSGGVCTTCSTSNNDAAKKEVTVDPKTGKTDVKEDANDPCNSKNKGTKTWTDNKCDEKNGKQEATGDTTVKTAQGDLNLSCKPGEQCGVVSGGGSGGSANPGTTAQQYASPTTAALSQIYTPPDKTTSDKIGAAFSNPSQYIGGQGSPVSAQAVEQAQNNVPASVYSPQASGVSGTTLGYDGDLGGGKSFTLNADVNKSNAVALVPSQSSQGDVNSVPAYNPVTSGATLESPVTIAAGSLQTSGATWDPNQPLGVSQENLNGVYAPGTVFGGIFGSPAAASTLGGDTSTPVAGPEGGNPIVFSYDSSTMARSEWDSIKGVLQTNPASLAGCNYCVVVNNGDKVSVYEGNQYGVEGRGITLISGNNVDGSNIGYGTVQDKLEFTLAQADPVFNSRGDAVQTLGHAIASDMAQYSADQPWWSKIALFGGDSGAAQLSVTKATETGLTQSSPFVVGYSSAELAAQVGKNNEFAATLMPGSNSGVPVGSDIGNGDRGLIAGEAGSPSGGQVTRLPGSSTGVPAGSDAASILAGNERGQEGSPSGKATPPPVSQYLPGISTGVPYGSDAAYPAIRGGIDTQSGEANAHPLPVLGSSANLLPDIQIPGAEGTQSGGRVQSVLGSSANTPDLAMESNYRELLRGTQGGLEPIKPFSIQSPSDLETGQKQVQVSIIDDKQFAAMYPASQGIISEGKVEPETVTATKPTETLRASDAPAVNAAPVSTPEQTVAEGKPSLVPVTARDVPESKSDASAGDKQQTTPRPVGSVDDTREVAPTPAKAYGAGATGGANGSGSISAAYDTGAPPGAAVSGGNSLPGSLSGLINSIFGPSAAPQAAQGTSGTYVPLFAHNTENPLWELESASPTPERVPDIATGDALASTRVKENSAGSPLVDTPPAPVASSPMPTKEASNMGNTLQKVASAVGQVLRALNPLASSPAQAEPSFKSASVPGIMPDGQQRRTSAGNLIPSYTAQQVQQMAGKTFTTTASHFNDPTGLGADGKQYPLNANEIFFSSPDLPAGTKVRVTINGVTMDGKIKDFGPDNVKLPGRNIDASQGACRAAGFCGAGLAKATVTVLSNSAPVPEQGRVVPKGEPAPQGVTGGSSPQSTRDNLQRTAESLNTPANRANNWEQLRKQALQSNLNEAKDKVRDQKPLTAQEQQALTKYLNGYEFKNGVIPDKSKALQAYGQLDRFISHTGDNYCAGTFATVMEKSGVDVPHYVYADDFYKDYKQSGAYHPKGDGYVPQPMDAFWIPKAGGTPETPLGTPYAQDGRPGRSNVMGHVGFVLKDNGNGTVTTWEGNGPGGQYGKFTRKVSEIAGFGDTGKYTSGKTGNQAAAAAAAGGAPGTQGSADRGFTKAAKPGEKPAAAPSKPSSQRYAFCIGSESCPVPGATQITEKNYLSPKDTPDTAKRIAEIASAVGSPQGGIMELDDCDKAGLAECQKVEKQVAEHNAAHPDKQLRIWVNNPQLSDAQGNKLSALLSDKNVTGMIAETDKDQGGKERTTPALLDALRKAAGKPDMNILAVGKKDFTDAFDAAAKGYSATGSSASSAEGDEPNAYTDVVGGSALAGGSQTGTPLQKFADAQKAPVFGAPGGNLLNPADVAKMSAEDRAKLDVYEPVESGKGGPGEKQVNGISYAPAGKLPHYLDQKATQARADMQLNSDPKLAGLRGNGSLHAEGTGGTRSVYQYGADGAKGKQVGIAHEVSDTQAKTIAAAKMRGVTTVEKNGQLYDSQGRRLELRSEGPRAAPQQKQAVRSSGQWGGKQVRLAGVPQKPMTNAQFVSTMRAKGITVSEEYVNARGHGNSNMTNVTIHGDVAGDRALTNLEKSRAASGGVGAHGVVTSDGVLHLYQPIDTIASHAGPANGEGPGFEVSGADNGRDLNDRQLATVKAIAQAAWESGASVGTHGQMQPGHRDGMECGPRCVAYVYGNQPIETEMLGLYAVDDATGAAQRFGDAFAASQVGSATGYTGFTSTDENGNPDGKMQDVKLQDIPGTVTAKLVTDADGNLGIQYDYTPPPPQEQNPDTRTPVERAADAYRNAFGGQQRGGGSPGGGGAGGSKGGQQGQQQQGQQKQEQAQPAPSQTQPATSAASLTCSQGVISGDASSTVAISWSCPTGTTPVGSGFSTVGARSGSIKVSVSTTSASVKYGIACSGTKTPQTASCTVAVKHPSVLLVAKPTSVAPGSAGHIEWSAKDVTTCSLYGPPTVLLVSAGATGNATTLPLAKPTRFRIRCETGATPITGSVVIGVTTDASTPVDTVLP